MKIITIIINILQKCVIKQKYNLIHTTFIRINFIWNINIKYTSKFNFFCIDCTSNISLNCQPNIF